MDSNMTLSSAIAYGDIVLLKDLSTGSHLRSELGYTDGLVADKLDPSVSGADLAPHNVFECLFRILPENTIYQVDKFCFC